MGRAGPRCRPWHHHTAANSFLALLVAAMVTAAAASGRHLFQNSHDNAGSPAAGSGAAPSPVPQDPAKQPQALASNGSAATNTSSEAAPLALQSPEPNSARGGGGNTTAGAPAAARVATLEQAPVVEPRRDNATAAPNMPLYGSGAPVVNATANDTSTIGALNATSPTAARSPEAPEDVAPTLDALPNATGAAASSAFADSPRANNTAANGAAAATVVPPQPGQGAAQLLAGAAAVEAMSATAMASAAAAVGWTPAALRERLATDTSLKYVPSTGGLVYACNFGHDDHAPHGELNTSHVAVRPPPDWLAPAGPVASSAAAAGGVAARNITPPGQGDPTPDREATFKLHSRPDAQRVIYLKFSGQLTRGTDWTRDWARQEINTPAFTLGAATRSGSERACMSVRARTTRACPFPYPWCHVLCGASHSPMLAASSPPCMLAALHAKHASSPADHTTYRWRPRLVQHRRAQGHNCHLACSCRGLLGLQRRRHHR